VGPIGDAMVDLISPKEGPEPSVPELQQQMSQMQQIIQALTKELEQKTRIIETDEVKYGRDVQLAQMKTSSDGDDKARKVHSDLLMQMRDLEVKLEIELAKIGSALAMKRGEIEMQLLHHHDDMTVAREERESAETQAEMDRQAQADLAETKAAAVNSQPTA